MSAHTGTQNTTAGRPNLRHYHRIAVELDGTITTGDGTEAPCRVTNLSRDGVMIPCDPDTLSRVIPNQESVAPHLAVPVHFDLCLPDGNQSPVRCQCDIIYVRRVSRDCFNMGMSFSAFEEEGQQRLDDYINQQLAKGV